MQAEINDGQFLEFAHVHDNIYGTSIRAVRDVAAQGKCCILDIDVQGARQVIHCRHRCLYNHFGYYYSAASWTSTSRAPARSVVSYAGGRVKRERQYCVLGWLLHASRDPHCKKCWNAISTLSHDLAQCRVEAQAAMPGLTQQFVVHKPVRRPTCRCGGRA